MQTYQVEFFGRKLGAIGAGESFAITIKADSDQGAITRLYENYEHITSLRIYRVNTEPRPFYISPATEGQ